MNISIICSIKISKTLKIVGNMLIGLIAPNSVKQLFSLEILTILADFKYVGTLRLISHRLNDS